MNAKTLHQNAQPLSPSSLQTSGKNKLAEGFRFGLKQLVQVLSPSQEPRIQARSSQDGQTLFDAYDPVTQQRIRGVSEADLRAWLEQRYYAAADFS